MPPRTKKTSISLDPKLEERAKRRAQQRGFMYSFSAYVAALITEDLKSDGEASEQLKAERRRDPYSPKVPN